MLVRYGETPIYVCDHLKKRYGEPLCQTFTTPHVDRAVVAAFLQVVEPARIEATLKVFDQLDDQKRMLRCLIQDVSLDSFSQAGQTRLHIRWHTGCVTTLTVPRPTSADAHRLDPTVVALVRELTQTYSDDRIAEILNARGLKTPQGLPWSYRRVIEARYRYRIPTACPITPRDHEPRGDGLLSVNAAAERLEISPNTIVLWARKGILSSE
jgi:hypothetical protein